MVEEYTQETPRFTSPEDELKYLREQVEAKERELEKRAEKENTFSKEALIRDEAQRYAALPREEVLSKGYALEEKDAEHAALGLAPEAHDVQMKELMKLTQEKGIRNAFSVLQKLQSPHLEDDFHRILVQIVKHGFPVKGMRQKGALWNVLHMTLFEIMIPEAHHASEQPLRELLSSMEALYAGLLSKDGEGAWHFTLEVALADNSDEIVFYGAVPDRRKDLFEKQVLSIFPEAVLTEQKNDYNVFVSDGVSVGARGYLEKEGIYPFKTYESFDVDPIHVLLNAFSKIEKEGGGAAVQFVFSPEGGATFSQYKEIVQKVEEGVPLKEALKVPKTLAGELAMGIFEETKGLVFGKSKKEEEEKKDAMRGQRDAAALEMFRKKIESRIVPVNIRIIASAKTGERADEILSHLTASFHQFESAQGNSLAFSRLSKYALFDHFKMFSFRDFAKRDAVPFNLREAVTVMHLPVKGFSAPQVKHIRAASASAPAGISREGIFLGVNRARGAETKVLLSKEDRLRHFYIIGQTGTGKTTFLKNMIAQDILQGDGVCMIDPHGSDIEDVLGMVPEYRYDDVIYFDPSYTERAFALNMLEYDERFPEQKTFAVNELFSIFKKLYHDTPESMGPIFEQYFRNATQLVMEDPATGSTLLDVSRVLADPKYRAVKLAACKNPVIKQFWEEIAMKAGGEASLQNVVPYITSKFDVFAADDYMRPLIAQQKSTFNFRRIMDERKILLVNLAKGRLGETNANLIGLILVGKILMAALSRVDKVVSEDLPPYYLYIDEFQNVTTDSIATILSEARKYKLSLAVAHQFIAQLHERIRDAVFGNVGSLASFRVGSDDAEFLEKQFAPVFTAHDLMNIENRNAYVRLLSGGMPQRPFTVEIAPPPKTDRARVEALKRMSYERYGKPRQEVEEAIRRRYAPLSAPRNEKL